MADLTKGQTRKLVNALWTWLQTSEAPESLQRGLKEIGLELRPIPTPKGEEGEWEAYGNYRIVQPPLPGHLKPTPVAVFVYRKDRDRVLSMHRALAGIEDPEAAMKAAREALSKIARGDSEVFDEDLGCMVEVAMDEKEASKWAAEALALLGAPK